MWRNFTTITRQQRQLSKVNVKLQARQAELEHLNRHDGLTGLFNRQTLKQLIKQDLARAKRQGGVTSLLLLNLDHFKHINDTHGHPAGDAVLRHVAGQGALHGHGGSPGRRRIHGAAARHRE